MSKQVFVGQMIALKLDTKISLTGATLMRILWKSPSTSGYWTVTLTEGTKLVYNTSDSDFNEAGEWQWQPYVEKNGKKYYGKISKQKITQKLN